MPRRVLFVIRGKLGDTLVAYATVRRYADTFPADEVTLLTRAGYAELLMREPGLRVLGFSSRIGMILKLIKLRMEPVFDALLVIWGFGPPIATIGRMIKARRKIYLDARFGALFPEFGDLSPHRLQSEPMWRAARLFAPELPQPERLEIPSLAARRAENAHVIGVAPLADEARRILSPQMLEALLTEVSRRHPGSPIRIFVNESDRGARELIEHGLPSNAEFCFFPELEHLVRGFSDLAHLYCTDTGLYHLAASMRIPATVFFGPTQPWRNMMPAQTESKGLRLNVLGTEHCEQKDCRSPICIDAAIRAFAGQSPPESLQSTPAHCPLRSHPQEALGGVFWHENPRDQAGPFSP